MLLSQWLLKGLGSVESEICDLDKILEDDINSFHATPCQHFLYNALRSPSSNQIRVK
jgi:hypothetical protein